MFDKVDQIGKGAFSTVYRVTKFDQNSPYNADTNKMGSDLYQARAREASMPSRKPKIRILVRRIETTSFERLVYYSRYLMLNM